MKKVLALLSGVYFLSACSVFGVQTAEEAPYTVQAKEGNIEIREYADLIVAQTAVTGDYEKSSGIAFRRLADYIFGNNRKEQSISMTAPVVQELENEEIAMTAPVLQEKSGQKWVMSFVMPARYTLETLPEPLDPDVEVKRVRGKKVASIRYSGLLTEDKITAKGKELLAWLDENGYKALSLPRSAGYDPPWTLPFLRRNEVLIDIE